jgi:hypothetical protein
LKLRKFVIEKSYEFSCFGKNLKLGSKVAQDKNSEIVLKKNIRRRKWN